MAILKLNGTEKEVNEIMYKGNSLNELQIDGVTAWEKSNIPLEYRALVEHYQAIIDSTKTMNGSTANVGGNWFTANAGSSGFDKTTTDWAFLQYLDVSEVTSMYATFAQLSDYLNNLDYLSTWDTSSVTNMGYMFSYTTSLSDVGGIATWNTGNVTNMDSLFSICRALLNVDGIANWNVSSVTNMSSMFSNCSALLNVDGMANWNVSSVTNMSSMFSSCYALLNVDGIATWDTDNITSFYYMFRGCTSLKTIKLLNAKNVTNVKYMLYDCTSLTSVKLNVSKLITLSYSDFALKNVPTTCTFYVPSSLVSSYQNAFYWNEFNIVGY